MIMKQSRALFTKLLAVTLVTALLWSCKQNETDPVTNEAQTQTDSNIETTAEVEESADGLDTEMTELEQLIGDKIDAARTSETITFKKCATVTITRDATTSTRTVVIDYGNGCEDATAAENGVNITRTGKLTIVYTGRWRAQNTVKTMTLENFAIAITKDGRTLTRTVNGTRIVTNQSTITFDLVNGLGGTPKYRIQNDLVITLPQLDADRQVREVNYKSDKSLVFMPALGKVKYTSPNAEATVDYGDGTCDRKVTVTVNGSTYEFERK